MSTNYPSGLDTLTNPSAGDYEDVVSHAGQHTNANDAIEAIEATLGTTAGTAALRNIGAGDYAVPDSQSASTSQSGIVELATEAEAIAGTATNLALTPDSASLYANNSIYRQAIINGNFDVWQRGTSITATTGSNFFADRWSNFSTGTTYATSRQSFTPGQTDVPNNPDYFIRNVIASSAGSSNRGTLLYKVEGVKNFSGETVTLSFWAKADSTKNISVELLQEFGTGGSPSATNLGMIVSKINITTSWAKYTVTGSVDSISGKTLGTNGNNYFQVIFWFDAGSDFDSRTDTLGQQSGTFDIAQVQLNAGSVALPFMPKSYEEELRACQRYYEKSYNQADAPGSVANGGGVVVIAGTAGRATAYFKVTKRTTPTCSVYSPNTGTVAKVYDYIDASDVAATISTITGENSVSIDFTATDSRRYGYHWIASAEL